MGRAPCCDKANVKKGPWSPEEDTKLKDYIHKYGTGGNWIALPHKAGLKRCGKSCRLRWLNYLRPNIKHGGFSDEEDRIICSLFATIGSRWSIIAGQLPGRTDNDIKNYWNTKLKKRLLSNISNNNPNSHNLKTDQLFFPSPFTTSQDVYNPAFNGSTLCQGPSLNQYQITEQNCGASEISYGKEYDQAYLYGGLEDQDQTLSFIENADDQWEGAPPLLDYGY